MKVVQNTQQLLNYCSAGVLRETSIVGLGLLGFKVRVQGLALDVFHHKIHTLSCNRAIDTFIKSNHLGMI